MAEPRPISPEAPGAAADVSAQAPSAAEPASGTAFVRGTLTVGGMLLALGFGALVWLDAANGTLRAGFVGRTIAWYLVAFAGFAVVMWATQRRPAITGRQNEHAWKWLLLLGLGLRVALVATTPTLSDDVYRYLWEGHLVTEGVSPYSFAVDDPAASDHDIGARALVNNPELASPYLPAAHGIFGAVAIAAPSQPSTMQVVMIAFDVVAAAMIVRLLALADLPRARLLLYWLNPLVILEVAHGAHLDAIVVALSMAGLLMTLSPKRATESRESSPPDRVNSPAFRKRLRNLASEAGGPALLAAATLTRPLALLFLPVLVWRWSWRQRVWWAVLVAAPILATGAASGFGFGGDGTGVFGSSRSYADTFRFNSGIYFWFERWIGGLGLDDKGWDEPVALTRLVVGAVVAAALVAVCAYARRDRGPRHDLRLVAVPVVVYVLGTPVLHPWYALLLLAFVPFLAPGHGEPADRWLTVAPWLALAALLIFSYLTYEDPARFAEREWIRRLEWLPTLSLVGVSCGWWFSKRLSGASCGTASS